MHFFAFINSWCFVHLNELSVIAFWPHPKGTNDTSPRALIDTGMKANQYPHTKTLDQK